MSCSNAFDKAGVSFASSVLGILEDSSPTSHSFYEEEKGTKVDKLMAQTFMLFWSFGGEERFFTMIGKKQKETVTYE